MGFSPMRRLGLWLLISTVFCRISSTDTSLEPNTHPIEVSGLSNMSIPFAVHGRIYITGCIENWQECIIVVQLDMTNVYSHGGRILIWKKVCSLQASWRWEMAFPATVAVRKSRSNSVQSHHKAVCVWWDDVPSAREAALLLVYSKYFCLSASLLSCLGWTAASHVLSKFSILASAEAASSNTRDLTRRGR